jgi:hypothetical protein
MSMRSPWSVGLLMILVAGIAMSNIGQPVAQRGPVQWALAALLVIAGGLMFLRKPFTRWVAVGVALLLAIDGLVSMKHPELGLPIPWYLSVVIGLYLVLRTLLTPRRGPAGGGKFAPPSDET